MIPTGPTATRRQQRLAWDAVAASMRDFSRAPTTLYYRSCEIALISRAFGALRGKRILKLDLWNEAFNTRIADWMRSEGADVYGLDLSEVVARRARENANGGGAARGFIRADIREVPFADGAFDFVYTMGTVEHIDEYEQAVREIARTLRPGGLAIVGVPHKWNVFLRPALVAFLYSRGIPAYRLTPFFFKAFEYAETRWEWPGRFGYLAAVVAEKR